MPAPAAFSPLSIATLNRRVRECLEGNFPLCWVAGEISNLTVASSGHAYFTLKDESAQARCVMFRNRHQLLGWKLANGQHIEARVLVSLYEARGDFQLNVETMRQAGTGNLFERFQQLKAKLEAEGLFAAGRKRPLPEFPHTLGIVTSLQAAALRDVLTTLARRAPQVAIILFPTPVQGDGAAPQIAAAIEAASRSGLCDALIVCRGGGSIEDLWAFNDEAVARAIRACTIPVISGVGHETDFTIADFAADLRAPTPTAAAELVARGERELLDKWHYLTQRLSSLVEDRLKLAERELQRLSPINALARYEGRLELSLANVQRNRQKLDTAIDRLLSKQEHELVKLTERLKDLGPGNVLSRGFSILRGLAGNVITDVGSLKSGDKVQAVFKRGRLNMTVDSIDEDTAYDQ